VGGIAPGGARVGAAAAPPDRRDWWIERLTRCHALLAAGAAS